MNRKCSRLSQAASNQLQLHQPPRPSTSIQYHQHLCVTQPMASWNRYKVHHRKRAQEARLSTLCQTESIEIAKRLNTIIRGRCKRANTQNILGMQDDQSQSSLDQKQKKKRKYDRQIEFGKKLLEICKKNKPEEPTAEEAKAHNRVKSQVQQYYDFKTHKKAKTEAVLLDFNKNQQSLYSRSRKKVIKVEKEQNRCLKERLVSEAKKMQSFEVVFYRSYLTKFKDRRKLLKGKNYLMKVVSS